MLWARANLGYVIGDVPPADPSDPNYLEPIAVSIKDAAKDFGSGVYVKDILDYSAEDLRMIVQDTDMLVDLHGSNEESKGLFTLLVRALPDGGV